MCAVMCTNSHIHLSFYRLHCVLVSHDLLLIIQRLFCLFFMFCQALNKLMFGRPLLQAAAVHEERLHELDIVVCCQETDQH